MVFVDNLVQGLLRAELVTTEPGRGWWIADARPYSVAEIVETVGRALADEGFEVSPNRVRVPDIVGRVAELADATIQRTGRYHQQLHVLGEMNKNIACDITGARRDLGYEPEYELYDGMRRQRPMVRRRRGSICDDQPRHRGERLLRLAARRAASVDRGHDVRVLDLHDAADRPSDVELRAG